MQLVSKIVKKTKAFFYVFKQSLISITYYGELIQPSTNIRFSFKYFLALSSIAVLVAATSHTIRQGPVLKSSIDSYILEFSRVFPKDLEVKIENGSFEINKEEPVVIPLERTIEVNGDNVIENLVVFLSEGTINDLSEFKTLILINESNILYRDNAGVQTISLESVPNVVINHDFMVVALERTTAFTGLSVAFLFVFALIFYSFFWVLLRTVYFLLMGGVLYLLSYIRGMNFDYPAACKIAIHSATLAILLEMFFSITGLTFNLPFWFFLTNTAMGVAVLSGLKKTEKIKVEKQ